MAISPHVAWLRSKVGSALLILPSVTVLVENGAGQVLLVRHRGFDRWGTVGGMVEPEEHPKQAAIREVEEETGMVVEIIELLTASGGPEFTITYPGGDQVTYVTTVYRARPIGGSERMDTDELTEMGWFGPSEIATLDLDPIARSLFSELGVTS